MVYKTSVDVIDLNTMTPRRPFLKGKKLPEKKRKEIFIGIADKVDSLYSPIRLSCSALFHFIDNIAHL